MLGGEHFGQVPKVAQLGRVFDRHHLEQAIAWVGARRHLHAAAVEARVGDRDRIAREAFLASIESNAEVSRPPGDQSTDRGIGVDQVAANQLRVIGDPVCVRVVARRCDTRERPSVGLAEVEGPLRALRKDPAGSRDVRRNGELTGEVVTSASREHSEQPIPVQGPSQCAHEPVAPEGDHGFTLCSCLSRGLGRMLDVAGFDHAVTEAEGAKLLIHARQQRARLASGGGRVNDEREPPVCAQASTAARRAAHSPRSVPFRPST